MAKTGQEIFDPQKLAQRVEKLRREGRLPSLQEFLRAAGEIRERYSPQLLAARQGPKKDPDGKPWVN